MNGLDFRCPLGQCEHSSMFHDWGEMWEDPMCCIEGCQCGKGGETDGDDLQ